MPQRPETQTATVSLVTQNAKSSRKRTGNQVHRDQHRSECGQFGEHVVDLIVCICHFDRDLCEVVGMRARENLFIVVQVLGHGDQVVLLNVDRISTGQP